MTEEEHRLWAEANGVLNDYLQARRPCEDCPIAWAHERRAEGRCNGVPGLVEARGSGTRKGWARRGRALLERGPDPGRRAHGSTGQVIDSGEVE